MRRLYSVLLYFLIPFILLRLIVRSKSNLAYRQRILERFSLGKNLPKDVDIWLHAVSLGEVVAASPLIEEFLKNQKVVLVTTMTPSGSKQVLDKFGDRVKHQYIPYDLPWCLKRFFKRINAKVGIILETEIWPNMIYFGHKYGVKYFLINARISDKAFKQYLKTGKFFKNILNLFTFIGAQSEVDAQRYKKLGASPDRVSVLGNIKFDIQHPGNKLKDYSDIKDLWGKNRPVLIAASTHDNEEKQLLANLQKLKNFIPEIILLIAPRHVERFTNVYELSKKYGFNTGLRSKLTSITEKTDVIVLDSIGELLGFYKLSDYAFVGGSLVPIGGHNVLEPILMGVPVFCGPFMQNSKSICDELQQSLAIVIAENVDYLFTSIIEMSTNDVGRKRQILNATEVLEKNRGCLVKYYDKVIQAIS